LHQPFLPSCIEETVIANGRCHCHKEHTLEQEIARDNDDDDDDDDNNNNNNNNNNIESGVNIQQ